MKIFGWMHRKLHRNVDYSMVSLKKDNESLARERKEPPTLMLDQDTKPLLLHQGHAALIDALDDWHDGILAIGTFGLDPHFPLLEYEYSVTEEQYSASDDASADEELDPSPAVRKALAKEFDEFFAPSNDAVAAEKETLKLGASAASVVVAAAEYAVEMEEIDVVVDSKKKRGERTTLADLFFADAAAGKCNAEEMKIAAVGRKMKMIKKKEKTERSAKDVRSLAKKLVPWKGEDSRPTAKLHRLLTRILKRKIHPELDREVHGDSNTFKSDPVVNKPVREQEMAGINGTNETVFIMV